MANKSRMHRRTFNDLSQKNSPLHVLAFRSHASAVKYGTTAPRNADNPLLDPDFRFRRTFFRKVLVVPPSECWKIFPRHWTTRTAKQKTRLKSNCPRSILARQNLKGVDQPHETKPTKSSTGSVLYTCARDPACQARPEYRSMGLIPAWRSLICAGLSHSTQTGRTCFAPAPPG